MLDACALPLRTVWPEAGLRHALSGVYLPGQYLSRVKRPGTRYIVRGIVQEDFALWVFCSIGLAALPVLHVLGLTLLAVSFWSIYELGYVDNDRIAARFEADPKLSAAFHDAPVATPRFLPWIWAFATGAGALFVLRWPDHPAPTDFAAWGAVLLATHGWFLMYNRFDKGTRVWLFAGLQFARGAAFAALVAIPLVGAIAIGAHVLAKWVPYCFYRLGGKDWPDEPVNLIRLLFFAVLAPLLCAAHGFSALLNWTTLGLLAWMLFRARREIAAAWNAASRLDRVGPGAT